MLAVVALAGLVVAFAFGAAFNRHLPLLAIFPQFGDFLIELEKPRKSPGVKLSLFQSGTDGAALF